MSWSDDARCLYCGAKLALHRKVLDEQFCSDAHQRSFRIEQDQLALERLSAHHAQLNPHELDAQLAAELRALEASETRPEIAAHNHNSGLSGLTALASQVGLEHLGLEPVDVDHDDRRMAHEYPAGSAYPARSPQSLHYEWLARETSGLATTGLATTGQAAVDSSSLAARPFAFSPAANSGVVNAGPAVLNQASSLESAIAVAQIGSETYDQPTDFETCTSEGSNDVPAQLALLGQASSQAKLELAEHEYDLAECELGPYFVEALDACESQACMALKPLLEPFESTGYELAVPQALAELTVASVGAGLAAQAANSAEVSAKDAASPLADYIVEPSLPADAYALLAADVDASFPDWSIVMPLFSNVFSNAFSNVFSNVFSGMPGAAQTGPGDMALVLSSPSKYLISASPETNSPSSLARSAAKGPFVSRPVGAAPLPVSPANGSPQSLALPRLPQPDSFGRAADLAGLPIESGLQRFHVSFTAEDSANQAKVTRAKIAAEFTAVAPLLPASKLHPVSRGNDITAGDKGRLQNAFTFWSGGTPDKAGGKHAWAAASDFWQHAPREFKLLAVAIPVLLALVFHPGLPKISFSTRSTAAHAKPPKATPVEAAAMEASTSVSSPSASGSPRFVAAKSNANAVVTDVDFAVGTPAVSKSADQSLSANLREHFAVFQESLAERAGVELNDDFRGSMDAWQSRGELAAGWSFDSNGFVRPGTMALLRPSVSLRDYDMEFLGLIDKKAVSWMVRAQDFDNYYAVKLLILRAEPLPVLAIRRYAVINGKPQKAVQIELPNPTRADIMYRVGMNIHDDTFLLTLQGKVVDTWSEPRLKRGGIGFFSSPGEESRLRWVHVTHQYDTLGRLCALLAPYSSAQ